MMILIWKNDRVLLSAIEKGVVFDLVIGPRSSGMEINSANSDLGSGQWKTIFWTYRCSRARWLMIHEPSILFDLRRVFLQRRMKNTAKTLKHG